MIFREEVLNVLLAELLSERNLLSVPETIVRGVTAAGKRKRSLPDVLIADLWGVRTVLEGRLERSGSVAASLLRDSRRRVEDGIAPVCIAVLYPEDAASGPNYATLRRKLASATFRVRVVTEADDGQWAKATLDDLADIIQRVYELLVGDDVVAAAADLIEEGVERAAEVLAASAGTLRRLADLLGIPAEPVTPAGKVTLPTLAKAEDLRIARIAALTIVNSLIFQEVVAQRQPRVSSLAKTFRGRDHPDALDAVWTFILEEIDYAPLFTLARELVREASTLSGIDNALARLADAAKKVTRYRASLRHDLMGRIYHRLLREAKYLGAFYTSVPAATLLLRLAARQLADGSDWSDKEQVAALRIADLACGTGTLLKAALEAVVDSYVRAAAARHEPLDIPGVHRSLIEDGLWGMDVVPFAIHLAAASLALHEPDTLFDGMHLYTMPIHGGSEMRLGSLDLLRGSTASPQATLFGQFEGPERTSASAAEVDALTVPPLDLCVMNPPFTRSVGGNLLFGHMPEKERKRMQQELASLVRSSLIVASITAGLGSVFTAIGHRYLKEGGILALVLPRAVLSGIAWEDTRRLLADTCEVSCIIVSHEPGHWNFSESTDLSECLLILRKGRQDTPPRPLTVNLWRQPRSSIEALYIASLLVDHTGSRLEAESGIDELVVGKVKVAEVVSCAPEVIRGLSWSEPAAFAQTELSRVAYHLRRGHLYLPGRGITRQLPMCALGDLGELGPDRRDIHDGFSRAASETAYPALWGHDTEATRSIRADSNAWLAPLAKKKPGRPLRNPNLLWSRAGRLLLAERIRLNTVRASAVLLPDRALSNTWWPVAVHGDLSCSAQDVEETLVLWLNSTLGLLSLMAARVDTEGPWIELKKPTLLQLQVLDPAAIPADARKALRSAYGQLAEQNLSTLLDIHDDEVRGEIDRAIAAAFDIDDDLRHLRELVSREPLLKATATTPREEPQEQVLPLP